MRGAELRRFFPAVVIVAGFVSGCALVLEHRLTRRHPAFEASPTITRTADGSPGDAINLALIGAEDSLLHAMHRAGWLPADPVTFKNSVRLGWDSLLHRHYEGAPVSSLFVWQRKQDLAFQKPAGPDPRKRHHVRFWRSERRDERGRPLWLGAATFDTGIGMSHRTGHFTHHISPAIDAERDKLLADLQHVAGLESVEWVSGFQPEASGRNGGGDPWQTDQRLAIGVLTEDEG